MPARLAYSMRYSAEVARARAACRARECSSPRPVMGRRVARVPSTRWEHGGQSCMEHLLCTTSVDARPPSRTGRPVMLPVHLAMTAINPLRCSRVPCVIGARRPAQIDAVRALTGRQPLGVHITGIHDMRARQQASVGEGRMETGRDGPVSHGASRGLPRRHHVRRMVFTGLGDMDCLADPRRRLLLRIPCLNGIGGTDTKPSGWDPCALGAPAHAVILAIALLHPHPSSRLDGGLFTSPARGMGGIERGQEGVAIHADGLGIRLTVLWTSGEAGRVQAPPLALPPLRQTMALEPRRGDRRHMVARMAEGCPYTLHAVDGGDRRQPMRRVGTLTPSGGAPRLRTTRGQEGLEKTRFRRPHEQTRAARTSDGAIETGVRECQAAGIRPSDTAADSLSRLAV